MGELSRTLTDKLALAVALGTHALPLFLLLLGLLLLIATPVIRVAITSTVLLLLLLSFFLGHVTQ